MRKIQDFNRLHMYPDVRFQVLHSYSNTLPYTTFIHQRLWLPTVTNSASVLWHRHSVCLCLHHGEVARKGVAYKSFGGLSMDTYSFIYVGFTVALLQGLRSVLPKCAVGTLSNNSHNILQIIVEAYNVSEAETPFPPRSLASLCVACWHLLISKGLTALLTAGADLRGRYGEQQAAAGLSHLLYLAL